MHRSGQRLDSQRSAEHIQVMARPLILTPTSNPNPSPSPNPNPTPTQILPNGLTVEQDAEFRGVQLTGDWFYAHDAKQVRGKG